MKWVNISTDTGTHAGLVQGDEVLLTDARDLIELLPDLDAARAGEAGRVAYAPERLLQPILRPRKILGIGLNYAAHVKESVSFIKNTAPSGGNVKFNENGRLWVPSGLASTPPMLP